MQTIERIVQMTGTQGSADIRIPSNYAQLFKFLTIQNLTDNSVALYPPGTEQPTAGLAIVTLGFYAIVTIPIYSDMQNGFSIVWTNPNGTNPDKQKSVRLVFSEENLGFNQSFAPSFSMGGNVVNTAVVAPLPEGAAKIGQVDVASLPSLPNGSNNIGNVGIASPLPAGTNHIGNVGVDTLPPKPSQDITFLPSSTETVSGQSPDEPVGPYRELRLFVDVTAITGTLDIALLSKDPVSGKYAPIATLPQITAAGTFTTAVDGGLGDVVAVQWTIGGTTPSVTFSVGGVTK